MTQHAAAGLILGIDTATRQGTLALADRPGNLLLERQWQAGQGHAASLLPGLELLLGEAGVSLREVAAVGVGTGPGGFSGLRVGLASAKTLAYVLGCPIVGVPTPHALASAAAASWPSDGEGGAAAAGQVPTLWAVVAPAGASDRYVSLVEVSADGPSSPEPPRVVPGEASLDTLVHGATLIALDGAPGVPSAALETGRSALGGLARSLVRLAAEALAAGRTDDVARLVPAYVALPRGVADAAASMAWSPDLR